MIEAPLLPLKLVGLWLLLTSVASLIAALAYPAYRRQLQACTPDRRSLLRLTYGLMPVVASTLVVVFMTNPFLAGLLVPEHCHAGQCGAHAPVLGGGTLASAGFAAFGALGGVLVLGALGWLVLGALGRLRTLERLTGLTARAGDHRVVESDGLIACCVGLLRPQVLVSRGLVTALPAAQLEAVLAHERAHAGRRDNLRGFLLHAATLAWPRGRRRELRKDLAADAEQACDVQAAEVTGDPHVVIDAMRRLGEPGSGAPLRRGAAFGEGDMAQRIDCLLDDAPSAGDRGLALLSLGLFWLLLVGVLTALSHGFLEWLTTAGF
ncbi:MAG: M56 family metallopeptidase [Xanthomonadales bacterium]|jgi:Zn-dependent protease with chaperone function|nr:M56 family metallopeptidase [Xanthomonadales bacterium]